MALLTTNSARRAGHRIIVWVSGTVLAAFAVVPLLWGVSTSFKSVADVYTFPPKWIPSPVTLANYASVIRNPALVHEFINTLIIASTTTVIALIISILGGYGFSRYRFRGRNTLLWTVLLTQLFPRVVVIVPYFVILRNFRLINTYQGLVLVYLIVVFPVAIWMIKGFFDNLPKEIEEAAIMDGCSILRMLWSIIIPMSRPALAAVTMYSFILAYNEFLFALVFTNGLAKRPLSVGLAFFIDDTGVNWGQLMAASLLMSLPAIVVFSFAQKLLVRGLSEGAVKG